MKPNITEEVKSSVYELGEFLIAFAKVNRATHLDKEGTPESDTDHTVMLSVIACALAQKFYPKYDIGKVAQYALVHDLVEVFAGDVMTIDHYAVDHDAKKKAEQKALAQITAKFGAMFPWLHETIETYESLKDPEARFVKAIDKSMPGILQRFSDSRVINQEFNDPKAFEDSMKAITQHMKDTYASDQQVAIELREKIAEELIENKYAHHGKKK